MPSIYLACLTNNTGWSGNDYPRYALQSFWDIWRGYTRKTKKYHKIVDIINNTQDFMLDSGAYHFMTHPNDHKGIDLEYYVNLYIQFINEHDINHFFEMDLDSALGYDEVKRLRKFIEDGTGKRCIPVWHKSRGVDEFYKYIEDGYTYIAFGGLVQNMELKKSDYPMLREMYQYAHERGVKIHALGNTNLRLIQSNTFFADSCDSISHTIGSKFCAYFEYENYELKRVDKPGTVFPKIKSSKYYVPPEEMHEDWIYGDELNARNLLTWYKFVENYDIGGIVETNNLYPYKQE